MAQGILIVIGFILLVSILLPIFVKLLWVWFEFVDEFIDGLIELIVERKEQK